MYKVKATANCKASNMVSVIESDRCRKQYMGEPENALHVRINGHRWDVNYRRLEEPMAHQFNSNDHSLKDLFVFNGRENPQRGSYLLQGKRKPLDPDSPYTGPGGTQS